MALIIGALDGETQSGEHQHIAIHDRTDLQTIVHIVAVAIFLFIDGIGVGTAVDVGHPAILYVGEQRPFVFRIGLTVEFPTFRVATLVCLTIVCRGHLISCGDDRGVGLELHEPHTVCPLTRSRAPLVTNTTVEEVVVFFIAIFRFYAGATCCGGECGADGIVVKPVYLYKVWLLGHFPSMKWIPPCGSIRIA